MLVLAIVALEVPLARSVADRTDAEVRSQARGQADLVAATAADLLTPGRRPQLERLVDVAAGDVRGRVIVVNARGTLLADSEGTPAGRVYAGRPEIAAALAGRPDQRERPSATLGQDVLVTAVPIGGARPAGAVRITQSVAAVDRAVRRAWIGLVLVGLLVLGLGLAVGALIAGQIARPMRRLDAAARRVAQGDLSARAPEEGSTEQRSLARTFNEMTSRLERLVASQREFVADASHGLRTPLTGLRLRLEAFDGGRDDPDARRELDAAIHEVDRLAAIVDELLELGRAGEQAGAAEDVALAGLLDEVAARWSPAAGRRGQRVIVAPGAAGVTRLGRADLDRLLDALVENALAYAPEGTDVELAAAAGTIEVRDRGPGVDGEAEAVFERFHRGAAGRAGTPGSGLGLPIARALARRWGGDVGLRPRAGGGTVAEVRLPAA